LRGVAASIKIVYLPGLLQKQDISDWLAIRGNTKEKLLHLVQEAPEWVPEAVMVMEAALDEAEGPAPWEEPTPLTQSLQVSRCPVDVFPEWLAQWITAEAHATQTPPDLPAMLSLAVCGAALAKKFRVLVRTGWSEPLNLFSVTALPPGDRKSAVFSDVITPVLEFERGEQERMAPIIAELASEHRVLENRLKATEQTAAKTGDPTEAMQLKEEAKRLAKELAAHQVPDPPQFYCDDVTPEKLAKLLAQQGGRILQASPEGTAFEIAKGRYSETANFDVYLKGHAGDPLRSDRISRDKDAADQPALSVALAVQPDVIQELADQTSMRGRGFLARFLYSIPRSRVGCRTIAPAPVPEPVSRKYREMVLALWELPGTVDQTGKPAPHLLHFSREADAALREFERWLEPQLAEGEELSYLAGWANKLAGAIARIAGILHVADAVGRGMSWSTPITEKTVAKAIRLGRDYLIPHAKAAFGIMGADPRAELGNQVLRGLRRRVEEVESVEQAPLAVSRREIHQAHRGLFKTADVLDPVLDLLVKHGWLQPTGKGERGRGHRGPTFWVNPAVKGFSSEGDPPHSTNSTSSTPEESGPVEEVELVENAPVSLSEEIQDLHGDAWEGPDFARS
jgi:putative DNA primase/helicase